jgi:hypothetical protein
MALGGAEVKDLAQFGLATDEFGDCHRQIRGRPGWQGRRFRRSQGCLYLRPCRDCADLSGELIAPPGDCADQIAVDREGLA